MFMTDLLYIFVLIFVLMELTSECRFPVHFQPNCRLCCFQRFYFHMWMWLKIWVMVWYRVTPCLSVCLFCSALLLSVCWVSLRSLALSECFLVAQETVTSLRWNIPLFYSEALGKLTVRVFPWLCTVPAEEQVPLWISFTRKWDRIIQKSLK